MKTFHVGLAIAAAVALAGFSQLASQAADSTRPGLPSYLPIPGYNATTRANPQGSPLPSSDSTTNKTQLVFRDLKTGDSFYFLSDTKKAFAWTKLTDTTAQNNVNSNKTTIGGFVAVTKQ